MNRRHPFDQQSLVIARFPLLQAMEKCVAPLNALPDTCDTEHSPLMYSCAARWNGGHRELAGFGCNIDGDAGPDAVRNNQDCGSLGQLQLNRVTTFRTFPHSTGTGATHEPHYRQRLLDPVGFALHGNVHGARRSGTSPCVDSFGLTCASRTAGGRTDVRSVARGKPHLGRRLLHGAGRAA